MYGNCDSYDKQKRAKGPGRDDTEGRVPDSAPEKYERNRLRSLRDGLVLPIIPDVKTEPSVGEDPCVKLVRGTHEARCGEQQKRRSRKHGDEYAGCSQSYGEKPGQHKQAFLEIPVASVYSVRLTCKS